MHIRFRLALSTLPCTLVLTGVCLGQTTQQLSVDPFGNQGDGGCDHPSISADGRYVAFDSGASNLVSGDTNGWYDIFVHDFQTGVTERVSVDSNGNQGNYYSGSPSISADGRYVAFHSGASNLVPRDTNNKQDIFVHDRLTNVTEMVSVDSFGTQGHSSSNYPTISADGRYVAFDSLSSNLVPGDTGGRGDVFVHDRQTRVTERVSIDSLGTQGNNDSKRPSISADGSYVAYSSKASNLVPGDTNMYHDIFVYERQTSSTQRVSLGSLAAQGNYDSYYPFISAGGRYVTFLSSASNLVPGDTNNAPDVFVHDLTTSMTERVNVNSFGAQGDGYSDRASISADGRYVAIQSRASNLVPGDTNDREDIFVHDRMTGLTERVSINSFGVQGNQNSFRASISFDGRYVAFGSVASNLVPGDASNWNTDIFLHDRWSGLGENSIYLTGPITSQVLFPVDLSWFTTRGNSQYWLAYSLNMNGAIIGGHNFDIGSPMTVLANGINAANGTGSFTSAPVPPSAAGLTLYFEVAARDGAGVLYDSNVHAVTFY